MLIKKPKAELRSAGKSARRVLTYEEREFASELICAAAIRAPYFQRAKYIACYLPADDEVNCWRLIKRAWLMKKRIFVPTVQKNSKLRFVEFRDDSETHTNKYGLVEPVNDVQFDPRKLDVVFTPLVAFDLDGNRIGMGGGYYDRAFSFLNRRQHLRKPKLVGLAFDSQRVEHIDASAWDIPLFHVITESESPL